MLNLTALPTCADQSGLSWHGAQRDGLPGLEISWPRANASSTEAVPEASRWTTQTTAEAGLVPLEVTTGEPEPKRYVRPPLATSDSVGAPELETPNRNARRKSLAPS